MALSLRPTLLPALAQRSFYSFIHRTKSPESTLAWPLGTVAAEVGPSTIPAPLPWAWATLAWPLAWAALAWPLAWPLAWSLALLVFSLALVFSFSFALSSSSSAWALIGVVPDTSTLVALGVNCCQDCTASMCRFLVAVLLEPRVLPLSIFLISPSAGGCPITLVLLERDHPVP